MHHTQFRTNYSLFMPFYDYMYGTMDKSTDTLHENSLCQKEESPDVVHLTHLTTPDSIYHMRLGFASLASKPHTSNSKWYLWILWPITLWSILITRIYGKTFVVERNVFKSLNLQTWAIPKYMIQVCISLFIYMYIFLFYFIFKIINECLICSTILIGKEKTSMTLLKKLL